MASTLMGEMTIGLQNVQKIQKFSKNCIELVASQLQTHRSVVTGLHGEWKLAAKWPRISEWNVVLL